MTDRERLIDLIRGAKKHTKNANSDLERNMIFAEYLLEHGVTVTEDAERALKERENNA